MRTITLFVALILSWSSTQRLSAQSLYYPPVTGNEWETVSLEELDWCMEGMLPLHDFLETSNTKAFIVLKDGRIAIEWYFGTFTQDSVWYWASAGKSLTAFLVGRAQQDGLIDIDEPSSNYLGQGWTSLTTEQEQAITVRHQLTMTTGLDDGVPDVDCTDPECLTFLADPGTRWAYHNAPYTMLEGVIVNTSNLTLNQYTFNTLTPSTGIVGLYVPLNYNNVFFSRARSMARFGLLTLGNGTWDGTPILGDPGYFNAMITPSQNLNQAYGYLWWLNGQENYMLPGLQLEIQGMIMPNAPPDAVNAMGKNGQLINVVPSQGLVLIRMGNIPGTPVFVPNFYNNDIWQYLNEVICASTSVMDRATHQGVQLSPNPAAEIVLIQGLSATIGSLVVQGMDGRQYDVRRSGDRLHVGHLADGAYVIRMILNDGTMVMDRFQVQHGR